MVKRIAILVLSAMAIGSGFNVLPAQGALSLPQKLSGRILLQVQEHGEAWYVYPVDLKRYYLGRPDDAFAIMRNLSLGVTNQDLNRIPIGIIGLSGYDSDGDGLTDDFERSQATDIHHWDTDRDGYSDYAEIVSGYSPLNPRYEKIGFDRNFQERMAGRILLQVECLGEAWYVDPVSLKRYYLGRPADAFNIMRTFGLGITNSNLSQIPVGRINYYSSVQPQPVQPQPVIYYPPVNSPPATCAPVVNCNVTVNCNNNTACPASSACYYSAPCPTAVCSNSTACPTGANSSSTAYSSSLVNNQMAINTARLIVNVSDPLYHSGSLLFNYKIFEPYESVILDSHGNAIDLYSVVNYSPCFKTDSYGNCLARHEDVRVLIGTAPDNISESNFTARQNNGHVSAIVRAANNDYAHFFIDGLPSGAYYFQLGVRSSDNSGYSYLSNVVHHYVINDDDYNNNLSLSGGNGAVIIDTVNRQATLKLNELDAVDQVCTVSNAGMSCVPRPSFYPMRYVILAGVDASNLTPWYINSIAQYGFVNHFPLPEFMEPISIPLTFNPNAGGNYYFQIVRLDKEYNQYQAYSNIVQVRVGN